MKIAFFSDEPLITSGGSYSFTNILKEEIESSNTTYEYCFLFIDKSHPKYIIKNNIKYINIYKDNNISLFNKFINKINLFFNINKKRINKFNYIDKIIKDENIDLLCVIGTYKIVTTFPFIYIIWDIAHRVLPCFPEVTKNNEWESRENTLNYMLYHATYIVTGNESGKKEIINNYNINPEKIHIIPFPVSSIYINNNETLNKLNNIVEPFIFYPAQFWPHKNHITLIESIAYIRDNKDIIINCYFTGKDFGNLLFITEQIKKYNLQNQVFIMGFIEQSTLIYLYKNALAMTYVSLLGPNNLPPLEAIAMGCPLIYSNIPGHMEQMEGTGISVNPLNSNEIGEAIYNLYINQDFRKRLINSELKLSKKYLDYSYLKQLELLFNDFKQYLKTWKNI